MCSDKSIHLTDGRQLGYSEWGAPNGAPILFFHGTPGSRLEHYSDTSIVEKMNVRLIVVERPGYGLSDYSSHRTLLDWPDDITQLADTLGLDRFTVMGFSGGGPYALSCAHNLPNRINEVVLLSSTAPFDAPGLLNDMVDGNRAMFELAATQPDKLEAQLAEVASTPEALLAIFEGSLPEPDKAIFADADFRNMYKASLGASLIQGLNGMVWDMGITARPWGFDPAEIITPVQLYHGEQDLNVPVTMGRYLAEVIPNCDAMMFPNEGHFLMFRYWQTILEKLINH